MIDPEFDVIIIGSGPAGVAAAYPLVKEGIRVLMVDGGKNSKISPPTEDFLSLRAKDTNQWKWMVGSDFHSLKMHDAVSPKLRTPPLAYVFEQFKELNRISSDNFITIGSLATGGLSNAWGCGVARFSKEEFKNFPFQESEMQESFASVAMRIGLSGRSSDDLAGYFGLDEWAQAPVELDNIHSHLLCRYKNLKHTMTPLGFKMGRARVAALTENQVDRLKCNSCGNCLWGCSRRTLYSAADEIPSLRKYDNFFFKSGFLVEELSRKNGFWIVEGESLVDGQRKMISARKILLAAGTLATTKLTLKALKYNHPVPLLSCPTAAFMVWLPKFLGISRASSASIGQIAFTLALKSNVSAFGATFLTNSINISEFVRHAPLTSSNGISLFSNLLSSCIVGNMFLPGNLTVASVKVQENGNLNVTGKHSDLVNPLMNEAEKKLRKVFWKLGAILLPKSFTIGSVGNDIHYAGTIPMKLTPSIGESNSIGEVLTLDGLHVVDGACLPVLPAKSHTFMIMANADRIGRIIASYFSNKKTEI